MVTTLHLKTGLRGYLKEKIERKFSRKRITFGGPGISKDMFDWIAEVVPDNGTIIEFGAGYTSTKVLSARFSLISVEHNAKYLDIYQANYIHAPLDDEYGWYQREKLEVLRQIKPTVVLIDGPPGTGKRFGILKNLDLVKSAEFVVIDDTDRPSERLLAEIMAEQLNLKIHYFNGWAYLEKNKP